MKHINYHKSKKLKISMSKFQKMFIKIHKLQLNHFSQILQPNLINNLWIIQFKKNKMNFHD